MKNSTMLFLSTIAIIGSFSAIKTEFSPKEEPAVEKFTKTLQEAIYLCDKSNEDFHAKEEELKGLGPQLTSNQLAVIVNGELFNDIIEKNKKADCYNCKTLKSAFNDLQGICRGVIEAKEGDLTILQIIELRNNQMRQEVELTLTQDNK